LAARVDVQAHFLPDAYVGALTAEAARDEAFGRVVAPLLGSPPGSMIRRADEARIAELDEAGLDVQVVSLVPPGATFGSAGLAAETARAANDELVAAAAASGGRLQVLATLPLPHVEEALAELDRVGGVPVVRGVSLPTPSAPWTLDDARFDPVYRRLAELGKLLVLHPALEELPPAYDDWALSASIAPVVSSTIGALRLVLSGALDRAPELQVLVPHLGGTLPFLLERISSRSGRGDAEHDLVHYFRERMYLDSCSFHPPALRCSIDTFGADRIFLGSDYPPRARLDEAIADIEASDLSRRTRDAILGGNALRWFAPATP
jgi:predicted TIM-barrel fold metal-dependent hydrolase